MILLTGAGGFLGSEIVRQAIASNIALRAAIRPGSRLALPVAPVNVDVRDIGQIEDAMAGIDVVIHAAAVAHISKAKRSVPPLFEAINEEGTANVALAAVRAKVTRLVVVSSLSVYGHATCGKKDEGAKCHPEGPYATSKYNAELRAEEVLRGSSTQLTILRMGTIYGEGDPGNVLRLVRSLDRGRFVWIGSGANRKSLIYHEDAARACLVAALCSSRDGHIFNVAADAYSMREIVEGIAAALGKTVPTWSLSEKIAIRTALLASAAVHGRGPLGNLPEVLRKWLADDVYDLERFQNVYDFHPTVMLRDGLAKEVGWYQSVLKRERQA